MLRVNQELWPLMPRDMLTFDGNDQITGVRAPKPWTTGEANVHELPTGKYAPRDIAGYGPLGSPAVVRQVEFDAYPVDEDGNLTSFPQSSSSSVYGRTIQDKVAHKVSNQLELGLDPNYRRLLETHLGLTVVSPIVEFVDHSAADRLVSAQ